MSRESIKKCPWKKTKKNKKRPGKITKNQETSMEITKNQETFRENNKKSKKHPEKITKNKNKTSRENNKKPKQHRRKYVQITTFGHPCTSLQKTVLLLLKPFLTILFVIFILLYKKTQPILKNDCIIGWKLMFPILLSPKLT